MKRSFLLLLFVFCFFVFPVAAQQEAEFTITEQELERLEAIYKNWESNRQALQLQVQSLKERLTEALMKSEELSNQLTEAREALKNSEQSLSVYEREVQESTMKQQAAVEALKKSRYKLIIAVISLSSILGLIIILKLVFIFIKIKTGFLKII